jgi:hypothetical protein
MESSLLTARRNARVIYFNYNERACGISNGNRAPRPLTGGPNGFTSFGNALTRAELIITPEEIELNCPTGVVPSGSTYTFLTHTTYPDLPNYYYRVYNTNTNTWSDLIDSGYSVDDYSYDFASEEDSKWFVIGYSKDSTAYVQIINPNTATIVRTLTYSIANNNNGRRDDDNGFVYNYYNGTGYVFGALLFSTNTLIETTIDVDDSYGVYDTYILESCVMVRMSKYGSTKFYLIKGSTTTMVQESFDIDEMESNDTIICGSLENEQGFITTIFCVDTNGNYKTYSLPSETYTNSSVNIFGINKDRFFVECYKEGLEDIYVFNSTGTLNPVVKSNIENPDTRYFADDDDQTGQSNIFVISNYNEGYVDYGTGDIYVLFDGASEFQTISFTGNNQKFQYSEFNSETVFVPYTDGTKYYMKTIRSTGIVNTILRDYEPANYTDMEILNNYCYVELNTTDNKTWHIVKNDGTVSANGTVDGYDNDELAGNVLMRRDYSTVGVFINGQYTELEYYDQIRNPYDVFDSNTVFGYNYSNSANNVVVASVEHGIQYQTVPILGDQNQIYHLTKYIIFMKSDPFELYIVSYNGQLYTYITEETINGGYRLRNTDNHILIRYTVNDIRKYVIFNSDINEFRQLSEPGQLGNSYDVYSNFPHINWEDD